MFSLFIRRRDKRCQICRSEFNLQCAHGFSRGYMATRWDYTTPNAWALCSGDHKAMTHKPLEWEDWMTERLGVGLYLRLRLMAVRGGMPDVGWTIMDLRERLAELGVAA